MSGCTIEVHRSSNVLRRGCLKPVHAMISSQPQSQRVSPATRYPSGLAYHPWSQVIELESVSCFKHKRMRLTKKKIFSDGHTRNIALGPEQCTLAGTRVECRQYLAPRFLVWDQELESLDPVGTSLSSVGKATPGALSASDHPLESKARERKNRTVRTPPKVSSGPSRTMFIQDRCLARG